MSPVSYSNSKAATTEHGVVLVVRSDQKQEKRSLSLGLDPRRAIEICLADRHSVGEVDQHG